VAEDERKGRASYLYKISALITEHAEELALIESLEVGKTLAGARGEMAHCADLWHFAAGLVRGSKARRTTRSGPMRLASCCASRSASSVS